MADSATGAVETSPAPADPSPQWQQDLAQIQEYLAAGETPPGGLSAALQHAISDYISDRSTPIPSDRSNLADPAFQSSALSSIQSDFAQYGVAGSDVIEDAFAAVANYSTQATGQSQQTAAATTADPVNLATGQFVHSVSDFTVLGAGMDFGFSRTYMSGVLYQGPLGANWDHSANLWLRVNSDQTLTVMTGQLRPLSFVQQQYFGYYIATGCDDVIVPNGTSQFTQTSPSGTTTIYQSQAADGVLYQATSITDRYGNYLAFTYASTDNGYLLQQVQVNTAQRVVEFHYDSQGRISTIQLFPVTFPAEYVPPDVSPTATRTWTYTLDDFGDLVAVTGPVTDDFPSGCTQQYCYSTPSSYAVRPHDLLTIIDPNGDAYIENAYGNDVGTVAYGRVVSQRVGEGVYDFGWTTVIQDPSWNYSDEDCPTSAVTVKQRNGHPVSYVLSALGNVLLSRETVSTAAGLQTVVWRYAYDSDGRQIGRLSPEGRMTQTYFGRAYYYDINYGTIAPPSTSEDQNLTQAIYATFANVLATVQRGTLFAFSQLSDDLAIYGDIFPPAKSPNALGGVDIVVKYQYEPVFQQRSMSSDPRYTNSADPNAAESAAYGQHLTSVTFSDMTGLTAIPVAVTYPTTTYPTPLPDGSTGVVAATLTFDVYDANGRLTQFTDPAGNVTGQSYYAGPSTREGFLASKTVGLGTLNLVTNYSVNEAGQVVSVTDPLGNVTQYLVDARGVVRATSFPIAGYVVTSSYDGNAQVISTLTAIINPDGSVTAGSPDVWMCAYNSELQPLTTSVGDSSGAPLRQTSRVYDAAGSLIRLELPRGNSICYEYDERLLLTAVHRGCCSPEAATTTYTYDLDGNRIGSTDPRGYSTKQQLDAFGRPIAITDSVGTLQRIDYDQLGNATVQRWFDKSSGAYALLRRNEFAYDERGKLKHVQQAMFAAPIPTADPWGAPDTQYQIALGAGRVEVYDTLTYLDADQRPFRLVDANGNVSTITYDPANRRTSLLSAGGSYEAYVYDPAGNVTRRDHCCADSTGTLRAVISTGFQYDALNRLCITTDGAGNSVTLGVDSRGLLRTRTDALGHLTQWGYSPYRERWSETHVLLQGGRAPPIGLTTRFAYDANSNLVKLTDPLGNATTFDYDALDRPSRATNSDGTSRSTSYDRSGNPIKRVDEDGVVVTQSFDPANRLTAISVTPNAMVPAAAEVSASFSYDGLGNLIAHQNAFASVTRDCDSLGRCYEESFVYSGPLGGVPSPLVIKRVFDGLSNAMQLGYPSGQVLKQSYNADNRLIEIESLGKSNPYPGDAASPASQVLLQKQWWAVLDVGSICGNGATLARSYDPAARRIADKCTLPTGSVVQWQQLWDGVGNCKVAIDASGRRANGGAYSYDSADRLTDEGAVRAPTVFAASRIAPPAARPVGVWAPSTQGVIDSMIAGYASARAAPVQFRYDMSGNRTQLQRGTRSVVYTASTRNEYLVIGSSTAAYTRTGRLLADGSKGYAYNFRGQLVQAIAVSTGRVLLQVYHDALGRVAGITEAGRTRVLVADGTNAIELYDNGVLSALNVFEETDRLSFFASDGTDQYVLRDVLESTRLTINGSTTATRFVRYDPFGGLLSAAPATPIRYSGKYGYTAIGWYDFRLRQLIPEWGRFAQPDPAGFVDGANLYMFVGNNPMSTRDATGTEGRRVASPSNSEGKSQVSPANGNDSSVAGPLHQQYSLGGNAVGGVALNYNALHINSPTSIEVEQPPERGPPSKLARQYGTIGPGPSAPPKELNRQAFLEWGDLLDQANTDPFALMTVMLAVHSANSDSVDELVSRANMAQSFLDIAAFLGSAAASNISVDRTTGEQSEVDLNDSVSSAAAAATQSARASQNAHMTSALKSAQMRQSSQAQQILDLYGK